jgi:hypothetical protein
MEHKISTELPQLPTDPGEQAPRAVDALGSNDLTEKGQTQAVEAGQPTAPAPSSAQFAQTNGQAATQQADPYVTVGQPVVPGMPIIADDADLIEKEWVLKAKEIVARTRQDPYEQNKEVERMKADYMKKRYNKDIKITED